MKKRLNALTAINKFYVKNEDDAWLRVHSRIEGADAFAVDNGSGDTMYVIFSESGCIIKGFDHESPFSPYAREDMSIWAGIYDEVPQSLLAELDDPCYEKENVTFCVWREVSQNEWRKGNIDNPDNDDDGFDFLIGYLCPTAEDCCEWAQDYFEDEDVSLETVREFYSKETL